MHEVCKVCPSAFQKLGGNSRFIHGAGGQHKSEFFQAGDRPDEMFWLILGDTGYGGRSGLLPLAREIVRGRIL